MEQERHHRHALGRRAPSATGHYHSHAAATYLARTFREIKGDIQRLSKNFPAVLQTIVNFMRSHQDHPRSQRHQLQVLGRLYSKGDSYVRFLIEHLFIRSLHGLQRRKTPFQWSRFFEQVPGNLQKIYVNQKKP